MAIHIGATVFGMLLFAAGGARGVPSPTIELDGRPFLERESKSRVPDKEGKPPASDSKSDPAVAPGSPTSGEKPHIDQKKKTDNAADTSAITSLGESLDALRDRFNSGKGRHRFVALLSPT